MWGSRDGYLWWTPGLIRRAITVLAHFAVETVAHCIARRVLAPGPGDSFHVACEAIAPGRRSSCRLGDGGVKETLTTIFLLPECAYAEGQTPEALAEFRAYETTRRGGVPWRRLLAKHCFELRDCRNPELLGLLRTESAEEKRELNHGTDKLQTRERHRLKGGASSPHVGKAGTKPTVAGETE